MDEKPDNAWLEDQGFTTGVLQGCLYKDLARGNAMVIELLEDRIVALLYIEGSSAKYAKIGIQAGFKSQQILMLCLCAGAGLKRRCLLGCKFRPNEPCLIARSLDCFQTPKHSSLESQHAQESDHQAMV